MFEYDDSQLRAFGADVFAAYGEVNRVPDADAYVWGGRMQFDAVTLGYAIARAKHLGALRTALGLTRPNAPTALQGNLVVRGQFFMKDNGDPFTAIQCSDFALLAKFQNGEDITPVLAQRADCGFNMLRVWTAFDIAGIGTFTTLDYSRIPPFVALCASYGLYVEFCAYTGWNDMWHWGNLWKAALGCPILPLLELVNELDQNTNEPDALGRVFNVDLFKQAPPPLLSAHGSNGSQAVPVRPAWSYETFHTNDASEWPRKVGHNAMEMAAGADSGGAGSGVPCLANENTRYPDRAESSVWAMDAAAGGALLCAGSCYHSVRGKASQLWDGTEEACARLWASGAQGVNLMCQDGAYRHATELETPDDLRVYQRVLFGGGVAFTVVIRK